MRFGGSLQAGSSLAGTVAAAPADISHALRAGAAGECRRPHLRGGSRVAEVPASVENSTVETYHRLPHCPATFRRTGVAFLRPYPPRTCPNSRERCWARHPRLGPIGKAWLVKVRSCSWRKQNRSEERRVGEECR